MVPQESPRGRWDGEIHIPITVDKGLSTHIWPHPALGKLVISVVFKAALLEEHWSQHLLPRANT